MTALPERDPLRILDELYRNQSRRIYASLVRLLRDFDLAEEAMHEAFSAALERWSVEGVPTNPRAWLVSTGRFKAIDSLRRRGRFDELKSEIAARFEEVAGTNAARRDDEIEDDRLRLIFTCCHPAIAPQVQVPLTLREVCGLTTEQIASAFLTAPAAMAQRIVRGKAKIRDAGIPFAIPTAADYAERLDAVLAVVYLVFNEGYSTSSGESALRVDLTSEAIRLGRLLVELAPQPESLGLLALMLLQDSRRAARFSPVGDLVLLEDQDRESWDRPAIAEGQTLLSRALASRRFGSYTVQAAIASVHAEARSAADTDWRQIVALYDALLAIHPSPVVELNRAVAVAMHAGPEAGLAIVEELERRDELTDYHLLHAARADLNRRLGRLVEARSSYERALELVRQEPERRFLLSRLKQL